jgi:hypothetical protein
MSTISSNIVNDLMNEGTVSASGGVESDAPHRVPDSVPPTASGEKVGDHGRAFLGIKKSGLSPI